MNEYKAAYWVDPNGKILRLTEPLHITQILHNPEKFGENEKDLRALYDKNKEKYGSEGKTRDEVMRRVIKKGFIRVRLYTGGGDYWSVTIERFGRKEKKTLQVWAKEAAKNKVVGKYADVKIVELSRDKVHEYEVDDLVKGDHLYESEIIEDFSPKVVKLSEFGFKGSLVKKVLSQLS
ncbi:MAG: hypothetical protein ACO2ZZ_14675 [Cyclobacteriaceae bacterium]|jgi:hypothetical protein